MGTKRWYHLALLYFALGLVFNGPVSAAKLQYTTTPMGGDAWRYDYFLVNDGVAMLAEWTVHFDRDQYRALTVLASPSGWDSLVVQPDDAIPANGFFDSLATVPGLVPGHSVGGFAVGFRFVGQGIPGTQAFEAVDPTTFVALQTGFTERMATPIPEPASTALLLVGLVALATRSILQSAKRPGRERSLCNGNAAEAV